MYVLLEILAKNDYCDPYYEPTIVVHDSQYSLLIKMFSP